MRSIVSYVAAASALAFAAEAHATIEVVHFKVSSDHWFGDAAPFGLPAEPTLTGSVTVNSKYAGNAAFVGIDYTTGSRTWTLADIIPGALSSIDGVTYNFAGIVDRLVLELGSIDDETYVASYNTAGIAYPARPTAPGPRGTGIACNGCVRITSVVIATPEPETWALMLLGVGVLGLRLRETRARPRSLAHQSAETRFSREPVKPAIV
jgi:hypothetical protein